MEPSLEASHPSHPSHKNLEESSYSCYHCDDFHTNSQRDYERHVMSNHQKGTDDVNHPCYPTKADIERLGLKAQEKDWE